MAVLSVPKWQPCRHVEVCAATVLSCSRIVSLNYVPDNRPCFGPRLSHLSRVSLVRRGELTGQLIEHRAAHL
jgi:hypothetical protein